MKPDAPLKYSGWFRTVPTRLPGLQVCERLPLLAPEMHRIPLVRSVRQAVVEPSAKLCPGYGPLIARLRPSGLPVPDFVHVPEAFSNK